jgi:hypothetical protein
VQDIDAQHAGARVGAWLSQCVAAHRAGNPEQSDIPDGLEWLDGLAIDGKTVRNSATPGGMNVKLFSALLHHEQVVIAQITVPQDTTEVTCVPALLGPVDLTGKAVTMDAAHTQDTTADSYWAPSATTGVSKPPTGSATWPTEKTTNAPTPAPEPRSWP